MYEVHIITEQSELIIESLDNLQPEWVFFPHWSWMISEEIVTKYKCVIFHTSPLPYGRGGSPIQNQIIRGKYKSELCALRAVKELDKGPIYLRQPIDLSRGTAEEILIDISDSVFKMIPILIENPPAVVEQSGESFLFKRRHPWQSEIPYAFDDIRAAYDFIRMLDGEGYPKAYMNKGNVGIELSHARLSPDGTVTGVFKLGVKE